MEKYAIIKMRDNVKYGPWGSLIGQPLYYTFSVDDVDILNGPIELIQAACDVVGVKMTTALHKGDYYLTSRCRWERFEGEKVFYFLLDHPVITGKHVDINDNLEYAPGGIL